MHVMLRGTSLMEYVRLKIGLGHPYAITLGEANIRGLMRSRTCPAHRASKHWHMPVETQRSERRWHREDEYDVRGAG